MSKSKKSTKIDSRLFSYYFNHNLNQIAPGVIATGTIDPELQLKVQRLSLAQYERDLRTVGVGNNRLGNARVLNVGSDILLQGLKALTPKQKKQQAKAARYHRAQVKRQQKEQKPASKQQKERNGKLYGWQDEKLVHEKQQDVLAARNAMSFFISTFPGGELPYPTESSGWDDYQFGLRQAYEMSEAAYNELLGSLFTPFHASRKWK